LGPKPSFWIFTLNNLPGRSAGMTEQATKKWDWLRPRYARGKNPSETLWGKVKDLRQ
jgi:hypothetical protein